MILRKLFHLVKNAGLTEKSMQKISGCFMSLYGTLGLGRPPEVKFLILMEGRSGSTLLCDMLDSQSNVHAAANC